MTASEFNAQKFVKVRRRPLPTEGAAWTGYNGGFDLITRLGDREMEFAISGLNGGIQLAAWRGLEGEFTDPQINTIAFTVEPQDLPFEQALEIASSYCDEVSAAGLNMPASERATTGKPSEAELEKASQSMNGIAACSIRNDRESFEARVVPHDYGNLETSFRVEVSIHAYFEIEE